MQRIIVIALCLLVMFSLGAAAQTQQEMNITAGKDFEAADRELNKVYQKLLRRLEGDERRSLIAAEQAWIRFRDADCEFAALPSKGGSIHPLVYHGAMTAKTLARTEELRGYVDDYAGR